VVSLRPAAGLNGKFTILLVIATRAGTRARTDDENVILPVVRLGLRGQHVLRRAPLG